ncbi:MAG: hypothetical protein ACYCYI_08520 [Saccharofermentanales bacterium]
MELKYKPDFKESFKYWDALWQREVIDRPLLCVTAPRKGYESGRKWHDVTSRTTLAAKTQAGYDALLGSYDEYARSTAFLGEAIPFCMFDFGPDMYAALFGAEIFSSDTVETTWVHPIVEDWDRFDGTIKKGKGTVYDDYMKILKYATDFSEGKFLLSVPDMHSNMDALSALRGPQNLCFDLMDHPDEVEDALLKVRATYKPFYDELFETGNMKERGSIGWIPTYSAGRFATVQCDFSCMIGPEPMSRYVIPSLEEEVSYLDNACYHYDGKEALIHLDKILAISGIDMIQWVPGDGNPRSIEWMDLLHKIQAAGKGLWIYDWTMEEIKTRFKELDPRGLVFSVNAASEDEGLEFIEYVTKHM